MDVSIKTVQMIASDFKLLWTVISALRSLNIYTRAKNIDKKKKKN